MSQTDSTVALLISSPSIRTSGNWDDSPPAAKDIINGMMESDIIEFIVGTKVNEAHQDPNLPVDLEIRRNIIKRLHDILKQNYRKQVSIKYY